MKINDMVLWRRKLADMMEHDEWVVEGNVNIYQPIKAERVEHIVQKSYTYAFLIVASKLWTY